MWNERTWLVNVWWRIFSQGIVPCGMIAVSATGIWWTCRYLLRLAEPEGLVLTQGQKRLLGLLAGANGILLYLCRNVCDGKGGNTNRLMFAAWIWLAGALLAAAAMDAKTCYVYNYVWYWSLPALLILQGGEVLRCCRLDEVAGGMGAAMFYTTISGHIAPVLTFVLLQQLLFARLYGKADCYAFCICATALNTLGGGMAELLIHMLLSVILLAVVQAARGNVSSGGRLITAKPFLPYIISAFWGTVLVQVFLYR